MMSDANREIRSAEVEAWQRRQRPTARKAVRYLDHVIEELEELNLCGIKEVPNDVLADLNGLAEFVPQTPTIQWPTKVSGVLECCFQIQQRLLVEQLKAVH
jgi:hypothetical protein